MLKPANVDLTIWRKGTFDTKIAFWKDKAHTERYPVSNYAVRFVIDGGLTLTQGNGVTVQNENEVIVKLTATQTGEAKSMSRAHYHLEFVAAESGEVLIPIRGLLTFETP